ncbi:MAG: hypothetical protein MI923_10075 [Phycisphaerales bacterium]|nr:hypothetical protein [Phycisphaerales bacterium]
MLGPVNWREDGRHFQVGLRLRYSDRLAGVFAVRMRQLETVHHWLAAFFQATAVMLQIPGGADYQFTGEEDENDPLDEAASEFIWNADRDTLLSILAVCFERLGADEELLAQVPGGGNYETTELPTDFQLRLAGLDDNGLLNVAAEVLDRLIVIPALDEKERSVYENPEPAARRRRWWQKLVRRMWVKP